MKREKKGEFRGIFSFQSSSNARAPIQSDESETIQSEIKGRRGKDKMVKGQNSHDNSRN